MAENPTTIVVRAPWARGAARRTVGTMRELDHRINDGIDVKLLWNETSGTLTVRVADERAATYFEIEPPADEALRAFHHPYAYAA
jgi:hypothetical protein